MSSWLNETRVVTELAERLLSPKRTHYQEDFIKYKILECSHLRFQSHFVTNRFDEKLKTTVFSYSEGQPTCCIVYLHGFGSHRLEGASILSSLPINFALCCFDFSGSGKSQGSLSTYGLKESLDIQSILNMLREKYNYHRFVLWGRSMGAVASLLFSSEYEGNGVIFQVLDSPFSSFDKICQHHARQIFRFPDMFIDIGISILKDRLQGNIYNPFKIDVVTAARMSKIPALFVYCEEDKVIPSQNSIDIIADFNKKVLYERLLIPQNHNNFRSHDTLNRIFEIAQKYCSGQGIKQKLKHKKGIYQIISNCQTPKQPRKIMRLSGSRRSASKIKQSKIITQTSLTNPEQFQSAASCFFRNCSKPEK